MAKRTKQSPSAQETQMPLAAQPPRELPALVEYTVDGVAWRCSRFQLLAAEFPVTHGQLPLFHAVAGAQERGWLLVRRLFGLQPVQPPQDVSLDDLRLWDREELRAALGLSRPQFQAELDAVRGAWQGVKPREEPENPKSEVRSPKFEFDFPDSELLRQHGFVLRFQSVDEGAWFAQRVRDYEKILNEKFSAVLARNALMSELRIHQLDDLLNDGERCRAGSTDWKTNLKLRQELDKNYQDQIAQIREVCPWAGAIAGKYAFTGQVSDLTAAYQAYYGRGDTRLIDGILTATEVQVECRRSVQASEPRYRAGWVVHANAAKAGLWDPNWKSPFPPGLLKCLDEGWKVAFVSASDAAGLKVPDLEQDGPGGEYDALAALVKSERRNPKSEEHDENIKTTTPPDAGNHRLPNAAQWVVEKHPRRALRQRRQRRSELLVLLAAVRRSCEKSGFDWGEMLRREAAVAAFAKSEPGTPPGKSSRP
jgi:hypothetical protein